MAVKMQVLPDTMVSPETGEILYRDVRPFVVTYKGRTRTVDLPGYYPADGDDGVHVGDDMEASDAALRALKEEVEGIPSPATIRRVRKKLKLSQREAGSLLKVGVWVAEFTKADGTDTVMECTLDPKLLPPSDPTATKTERAPQPHLVHAYALDRQGWRAFDIRRLKQFYKKPEGL